MMFEKAFVAIAVLGLTYLAMTALTQKVADSFNNSAAMISQATGGRHG